MKAGGECLSAERLDIGEALAENWLPEVHTAVFASATMTVSGSLDVYKRQLLLMSMRATRAS